MSTVLIIILIVKTPAPGLFSSDFARLSRLIGEQVAVLDDEGRTHEGILASAQPESLILTLPGGQRHFEKRKVARAEKLRDGSIDGFIRGALLGSFLAFVSNTAYEAETGRDGGHDTWKYAAAFGAAGWIMDATEPNRQTIYRAPKPKPASVKLSVKF